MNGDFQELRQKLQTLIIGAINSIQFSLLKTCRNICQREIVVLYIVHQKICSAENFLRTPKIVCFKNMTHRLLILDQNKLREKVAPEVVYYLKNDPQVHFVLPDVAFIEMTKNAQFREETLRGSLRMLSEYPERVHAGKSLAQCFQDELRTMKPASHHMTHREHRKSIRSLLNSIRGEKEENQGFDRIINDPDGMYADFAKYYFDHEKNKERLSETIEEIAKSFPPDFLKDLRAKRISRDQRLNIIYKKGPLQLARILYRHRVPETQALLFARKKPMLLRECYSVWWLALDWISSGGFESSKPEKITNDLIDQEYAITATCFDGIISAEKRVVSAYEDLNSVLKRPVFPLGRK